MKRWICSVTLWAMTIWTAQCFMPQRQLRQKSHGLSQHLLFKETLFGKDQKICLDSRSSNRYMAAGDNASADRLDSINSDPESPVKDLLVIDDEDIESSWDDDDDEEEDEDENVMFRPHNFARKENWLKEATEEIFDTEAVPLGSLTEGDVESMIGLMVAWSRQNTVEAALIVERLLKRVVDDMHAGNSQVHVGNRMYSIVIDAWARSGHSSGAARAQEIHDTMIQTYKETKNEMMRPKKRSFYSLLKAWGRSRDPDATQKGEEVFEEMLTEWGDDKKARPDAGTIYQMLELYASDGSRSAIEKAEKLFNSTEELGIQKSASVYSAMQNVYTKSGRNAPENAMKVLQQMMDLSDEGDSAVRPNCLNFNVVLCAYSRDRRQHAADQAIELLQKMELPVTEGGYDVCPDKMSYAMVILACSRHRDANYGARRAEQLLERMEACAKEEALRREEVSSVAQPLVEMDVECFNVVLTALSKSQDPDVVDRVFKIIRRMENDYPDEVVRPNLRSYNAALNAMARVRTKDSAQQAEKLLEDMFEAYNNGTLSEKPDEFSYAAVLGAYQKLHTAEAAQRADDILVHMDKLYEDGVLDHPPDVFHCTIVCSTWAKSGLKMAPQKCTEILSRMTARYKEGFPKCKPTIRTFDAILDTFSRSNLPERAETLLYHMLSLSRDGDKDATPDAFSFDIVIHAFLRSNIRDAGQRAESVLERGLEFAEEEGGEMVKLRSFIALLKYYGSQKNVADSPYRAEYILNRLISLYEAGHTNLSPHVSCFTNVMEAYATQRNRDAGKCAETLLRQMIKLKRDYGAEHLEVNTGVINRVLNAWQASVGSEESGRRAERLLALMEEKHDEGNADMTPNFSSYSKVIGVWAKSPLPDKAERALAVLNRMKKRTRNGQLRGRIPEHAYALVINACAFSSTKDPKTQMRSFEIAQDMLDELIEESEGGNAKLEPNPPTYGWFFQALGRLAIPADVKSKSLEQTFKTCCTRGRLTQFVWTKMKEAITDEQFVNLLGREFPQLESKLKDDGNVKQAINFSELPKAWIHKEDPGSNNSRERTWPNYANRSRR